MFPSSAPGESPPPLPGNTHGNASHIRRDAVSEVHRGVVKTQNMVSDIYHMMQSQQWAGGRPQLVGATRVLSVTEYTLTVA